VNISGKVNEKYRITEVADPARKRDQVNQLKNIESKIKNELETEVIKTIAAFMNTKGGTLLIGVNDDGTISGIESDYSAFVNGKGYDTWQQHLKNLIRDRLGLENITYIQAEEFHVENKTVSWITVQKASAPVFMDYIQKGQPRTDFFFRALNTTEVLNPRHQMDYINSNWPGRTQETFKA
jgi:predicted HTH transcriptional regulator